jgi:hypothetical protein
MELELTQNERDLLLEILEEHDRGLIREIARAEHLEFRDELKNKETLLQSILNRLQFQQQEK